MMFGSRVVAAGLAVSAFGHAACAQSLFLKQDPIAINADGSPDRYADLRASSFIYFEPPEPRAFAIHDIVYIIIDENTRSQNFDRMETRKQIINNIELGALVSLSQLLEAQLRAGNIDNLSLLELQQQNDFRSQGRFDQDRRLNARISAEVIDVKPNGNLVLEARSVVDQDGEKRTVTLTGVARGIDVTQQNTILSNQLANLNISSTSEGELRNATKKGIITKVLETLFNF
ncbi:MAG: flagellar basal body L-ring protein FlgH [Planctomycetota bacterium]